MEFGLVAPVMLLIVVGVYSLTKGVILWQDVYYAARDIPVSASTVAAQPDGTSVLTPAQAQQAMSVVYADIPWIRNGIESSPVKSVTLTSVTFVPVGGCTPTATNSCRKPFVVWTASYAGAGGQSGGSFQTIKRQCGNPVQVGPTDPIPPGQFWNTIRTMNIIEPDAVIVADVLYQFTPLPPLGWILPKPITFSATGYWSARSAKPTLAASQQYTDYAPHDAAVTYCGTPPASY